MSEPEKILQAIDRAHNAYANQRTPDAMTVITLIDAARTLVDANPSQHLCDDIETDHLGFMWGVCTCGYRTANVPSTDLAVDDLMAHAVREAITVRPRNENYAEPPDQEKQ